MRQCRHSCLFVAVEVAVEAAPTKARKTRKRAAEVWRSRAVAVPMRIIMGGCQRVVAGLEEEEEEHAFSRLLQRVTAFLWDGEQPKGGEEVRLLVEEEEGKGMTSVSAVPVGQAAAAVHVLQPARVLPREEEL